MATGRGEAAWTLDQLSGLVASLAGLDSASGRALLLEQLAALGDAPGAVCWLEREQYAVGINPKHRDEVAGAVRLMEQDVGTVELSGDAEQYHLLVVNLSPGHDEWLALVRPQLPFGDRERVLLNGVGEVLGLSLASTRAIDKLKGRNALLGVLREVEHSISAQHSLDDTLQRLTDGARLLFGKVLTGVVLRGDDGQLMLVAGAPQVAPAPLQYPHVLKHASRLNALIQGTSVMEIPDYTALPEPNPEMAALGIRRVLIAPIRPGAQPLGCIMVSTPDPERLFSDDEREALRLLADHAGVAIDNARAREALAVTLAELERRSVTDDLTELLNRRGLFAAIETALANRGDREMSVLFIDFDRFKFVNDVHGHHVADLVLIAAAERLQHAAGGGVVGRLAGDEFIVLIDGDIAAGAELAARIRHDLEAPFDIEGITVHVGASVGVAALNGHGSASQLLMEADLAMLEAKQRGRGRSGPPGAGLRTGRSHQPGLERSIADALSRNSFDLFFQPIVELAKGTIDSVEVLLRWSDASGSPIAPESVLAVAADAGLLPVLDMAILGKALRALPELRQRTGRHCIGVAVNITSATVATPDLADRVLAALAAAGLDPSSLTLEMIETSAMDIDLTIENLSRLEHAGTVLALDNFGAGWSSLHRLRRVPMSRLKIDKSLVSSLCASDASDPIVNGLLQLAPAVGLEVVAEGVENPRQSAWLLEAGCRFGQGYHFGRPVCFEDLVEHVLQADGRTPLAAR